VAGGSVEELFEVSNGVLVGCGIGTQYAVSLQEHRVSEDREGRKMRRETNSKVCDRVVRRGRYSKAQLTPTDC
jgi:hypothetical protein